MMSVLVEMLVCIRSTYTYTYYVLIGLSPSDIDKCGNLLSLSTITQLPINDDTSNHGRDDITNESINNYYYYL